jgi:hypothetical protein
MTVSHLHSIGCERPTLLIPQAVIGVPIDRSLGVEQWFEVDGSFVPELQEVAEMLAGGGDVAVAVVVPTLFIKQEEHFLAFGILC